MKIAVLIFQVALALGHKAGNVGLRASGNTDASFLAAQAGKLIRVLKLDASKTEPHEEGELIPKDAPKQAEKQAGNTMDAVEADVQKKVEQDANNANRMAKGKAPHMLPDTPDAADPVEDAVENDVEAAQDASEGKVPKGVPNDIEGGKNVKATGHKRKKESAARDGEDEEEEAEVPLPGFDEFLPSCLVHTAEILQTIDVLYTDEQIKYALQNECILAKQFPNVVDDGFKNHKACMHFAAQLSEARHQELEDGSTDGYTRFCTKFYNHETGNKKKESRSSASSHSLLALMTIAAFGVLLN